MIVATSAAALSVAATAAAATTITGAGSTLVAPFVENVFGPDFAAANAGDTVTYGSIGSGGGIAQISAKSVDFGASDAPLTSAQDGGCTGCVEIPWALGATGISYNLSGVSNLNLSGPVIAQIYLGQITNWDDPAIKKLNPGVTFPNEKITPVYRSDGSGDTYAFTSYLSKVSPTWASQVGFATSVSWPAGIGTGGKGNSGVAAVVQSTPGAIGNNSSFYIAQDGLHGAAIENNAGKFIHAFPANVADAAKADVKTVPNLSTLSTSTATSIAAALSIVDSPYNAPKTKKGHKPPKLTKAQKTLYNEQAQAYPMATFTYVIVRPDAADIALLQKFIAFAVTAAEQHKGIALGFSPLPANISAADTKEINSL
jgi:phosphate transport system substrate-binding protein